MRLEYMRLKLTAPETSGGIHGRIVDMTFVGDATILEFRSDSGLQLTSKVLNVSAEDIPGVGGTCVAS